VDGQECNAGDQNYHGGEQREDEPCSALCGLRRGLSDAHGVDEGVRDEQEEVHILWPGSLVQGNRQPRLLETSG
jgi:hypothetical protein